MGVKNLWEILESCKKTLPLHHLQNKRVCIDLSCWIVQLQNVYKSHNSAQDKVYLRGLFHRLRALIALNCSLICVTDGSIPAIKLSTYRRRLGISSEVIRDETVSHMVSSLPRNMGSEFSCMIREAKVLAGALGIPCLNGIEEAEAQCALLNSESLCDGCFTADSDIFLFGAKTVYRDICLGSRGEGGYVVCYETAEIERKLGFGRNSLIALALLLGSDYSNGVNGHGPETACQLVKSIGDHAVLQRVESDGLMFAKKTKGSKKQGKSLRAYGNKENCLDHAQKNGVTGKDILEYDQLLQVMNAYLKPKCHSSDSEAVHRVLVHYPFERIQLQQLCDQFFGWTPEKTDEYILPKIAERDLRRFANLRSSSSRLGVQLPLHEMPVTCPISAIIKLRKVQGKDWFEVAWEKFDGLQSSVVPVDLIKSACPERIVEFEERKAQGKKKKPNGGGKARRPEKDPAVSEVDLKLQNLLLEIESGSNGYSNGAAAFRDPDVHCVAIPKVDPKLNNLLLDIEPESTGVSSGAACCDPEVSHTAILKADPKLNDSLLNTVSEYDLVFGAAGCGDSKIYSNVIPEVIDLLSPSPPIRPNKISKCQYIVDRQSGVIEISESETDESPEHAKKARELRSFIASINLDIE